MNLETVKAIAAIRHLNQSDLARAAGVSRQRVSQWFLAQLGDDFVNIQTNHLLAIARALQVSTDDLLHPLPLLDNDEDARRETTRLLWDGLYPDLVTLLIAALERKKDAIARIVQVNGLYAAAKLLGARVWRDFPKYKIFIKPTRRAELEKLWQFRQHQTKR